MTAVELRRCESALLDFIHFVQNKISPVSVEFLDILVNIKHGQFTTSIFYKPTDAPSYLYFHSSHHPISNTKASIPYSQFLHLRRLCSDKEDFLLQRNRMSDFFTACGYPTSVIENALRRAKQISRAYALNPAAPITNKRHIVSVLYHPHQPPSLPDSPIKLAYSSKQHYSWHYLL